MERRQAKVRAAESVEDKLEVLTEMQSMKYPVYPQTFALNALHRDRVPVGSAAGPAEPEPEPVLDPAALRAATCCRSTSTCGAGGANSATRRGRCNFALPGSVGGNPPGPSQPTQPGPGRRHPGNPTVKCKPRQYENHGFFDPCCYGHTQFHLLPDN
ncbi:hypothetical protein P7K49_012934 [Saguinus oedipus]|uniref:Uncharacterized protein n=1 Tax=Saguinus oedipus TaxID=9490 RepID=A0ABQ9VFW2_SAGOE|nr:hypothetical protein P7K49_012934 [Saguinus oedipus]